ncbi:glycine cleavage system protein GcvH [Legionella taurinensis]|uniref:Glycine cleavage system H protein n=1 Tax=Legionella taurinensis TaxID=70611 RepID=A0A3A5L1W9_9GAMM|nr:glycine cleavage system protein GcvH [Legionella taurinensis]MDX1836079.1 glycine cleavage system protein GcvH [Legionella taurinensis]PUT42145.1 glycine cleavage system protein GcvH [Legionella taurinensis]PUT44932.1 glycine cleavage system protein GcvH [Legionella taurinensis]PUT48254.1 glycine cleavage system protein GcvH [Legionella taurinensis]PUT49067.1 glycine cleavage system protein GcvH [Legionella taurinensis]
MNDLKFTQTHEWLKQNNGEMIVGITDHAQQLLGDMVFVELPEVGDVVSAGDELGVVESVKAASDFYAPLSGTVIAVNEEVNSNPALVNSDPYGAGWLVKMKASNPAELENLLNAEQYQQEIAEDH